MLSTTLRISRCGSSGSTGRGPKPVGGATIRRRQTVRRGLAYARGPDGRPPVTFDNMYQVLRDWGYNVIRLPISWNNLEPVAPVWNVERRHYVHTWNQTYLNDLEVDGHECARQWAHGDSRHAPGLLVAGAASHHELERHTRVLRGCRPAAVDVSHDGRQGQHDTARRLLQRDELVLSKPRGPAVHAHSRDAVAAPRRRVGSGSAISSRRRQGSPTPKRSSVPTSSTSRTSATSEVALRRDRPSCRRRARAFGVLQRTRTRADRTATELAALLPGCDGWLQRRQPRRTRDAHDEREADGTRQLGVLPPRLQLRRTGRSPTEWSATTTSASPS